MITTDQAKYDIGQKVYAYDQGEITEYFIKDIHIDEFGVFYDIEPDETFVDYHCSYDEYSQKRLFDKKSEALAYAIGIETKEAEFQAERMIRFIDELKKELAEAKKEEKRNKEKSK